MAVMIDTASETDLAAILASLDRAGLPQDGLADRLATTLIARQVGAIVGSAGKEGAV